MNTPSHSAEQPHFSSFRTEMGRSWDSEMRSLQPEEREEALSAIIEYCGDIENMRRLFRNQGIAPEKIAYDLMLLDNLYAQDANADIQLQELEDAGPSFWDSVLRLVRGKRMQHVMAGLAMLAIPMSAMDSIDIPQTTSEAGAQSAPETQNSFRARFAKWWQENIVFPGGSAMAQAAEDTFSEENLPAAPEGVDDILPSREERRSVLEAQAASKREKIAAQKKENDNREARQRVREISADTRKKLTEATTDSFGSFGRVLQSEIGKSERLQKLAADENQDEMVSFEKELLSVFDEIMYQSAEESLRQANLDALCDNSLEDASGVDQQEVNNVAKALCTELQGQLKNLKKIAEMGQEGLTINSAEVDASLQRLQENLNILAQQNISDLSQQEREKIAMALTEEIQNIKGLLRDKIEQLTDSELRQVAKKAGEIFSSGGEAVSSLAWSAPKFLNAVLLILGLLTGGAFLIIARKLVSGTKDGMSDLGSYAKEKGGAAKKAYERTRKGPPRPKGL